MSRSVVMDTNVAIVANGKASHAGDGCVRICVNTLVAIRDRYRMLLDDQGAILEEYRCYLSPSGQPGPGDAFFKWLWDNQGNLQHCRQIRITPVSDRRQFEEFPEDSNLADFDLSDRKFVAVAIASEEHPTILNAADTDWWNHRKALVVHGVTISFLCPELMRDGSATARRE